MVVPCQFPRGPRQRSAHVGTRRKTSRGLLVGLALVAGLGTAASPAGAAPTTMVDLGSASSYAVLSGASVGNTVSAPTAPHTTLRGDLGVKASAEPTGFPPGVVTGAFNIGNAAAAQAHADAATAYAAIAARPDGAPLAAALAGTTVSPGLHSFVGAASNTTTVTLDAGGDPNAVFVFQVNGALAMAAGSKVVLAGGAQASRVFWQVAGAGSVGATAGFVGTLIARDAVGIGAGTIVNGRALALGGALTLDNNQFYSAPPVVTIDGGPTATTTDTTPTISGTTDVEAPAVVTVKVGDQTLTAVPSDGAWSVTSEMLANATYPIVASATDGAGNLGSATQQLTVDTVLPVVTISGGATATTNDIDPTIRGTADVAPDTVVTVTIAGQTMSTLLQANGSWNVTPDPVGYGTWAISASVADPAGNVGGAEQQLTIAADPAPAPDPAPPADPAPPVAPVPPPPPVAPYVPPVAPIFVPVYVPVAPPVAPAPVDDGEPTAAEQATVAQIKRQKVKGSSLSVRTKVTADRAGRVVVTARGTVNIKGVKRTIKLRTSTAKLAARKSTTLKLRPTGSSKTRRAAFRTVRTAVRKGKHVTARLTIKVVDAAGNEHTTKRTVRLVR